MAEVPDVLKVEEAAALMRIGRTAAYQLANRYLATEGTEGMPVKRVGRQLRVPRDLLEAWLGTTLHAPASKPEPEVAPTTPRPRSTRRRTKNDAQLTLIAND